MSKRNLKIAKLYAISLLCIVYYFLLQNSNIIAEMVKKSERGRYGSFPTFFLSGLFKYGLLFVGIGIFIIVSFLLIKEKIHKDRHRGNHGKGEGVPSITAEYEKTGTSYKIYLRNETDKIVKIKDKFTLSPNEEKVFTFANRDSILLDIGAKFIFGEYGLEIDDKIGKIAGIGGEYWQKYNIPDNVDYGFVIVQPGEGDIVTE